MDSTVLEIEMNSTICFKRKKKGNFGIISVTCSPLSQPANGEYSYTTDGITTFVELQCNTGYDVTGTASVTCQSDGTWNFQQTLACGKWYYGFWIYMYL